MSNTNGKTINQNKKQMSPGNNGQAQQFPTRLSMVAYFLKGSKRYFLFSILFLCLMSALDLVNPKMISFTVDSIIGDTPTQLPGWVQTILGDVGGTAYLKSHLWLIAAAVIIVALLAGVCRYLQKLLNSMGAEALVKRMRDTLFDHIEHLPYSWYSENHTGDIIQRCTSDVDTVKRFLAEQMTSLFRIIVLVVMALYFMAGIHPIMTIVSAAFFPILVGYSLLFHRKIGSAFESVDEEEGKLSAIAQENLTGVRVVRAFGREIYERQRFEKQNVHYTGRWIRLMQILSLFWTSNDMITGLQVMIITILGSYYCVNGQITAGQFIAFVSYNAMLTWPVRALGRVIAQLSQANVSVDRIRVIMNSPIEQDKANVVAANLHGDIVFDHVSYRYTEDTGEVLNDVSFTVKAGSTVGILGGTGSGKSTLMYLLDRLYDLPEDCGRITIGGVNIADMKKEDLRGGIGMVLQEPYLFSRTLQENIAIANEEADNKEVRRVAKLASLDHSIEHFSQGYETFVGERGVTLSGGQKQRTAIAQMLICKSPIMVFDDSLSAVDAETDAKIRHALAENAGDATRILIAHRITTLSSADQIVVLDKGSVAEIGTHEELIAKEGIYKKIYDLQTQQSEEADAAADVNADGATNVNAGDATNVNADDAHDVTDAGTFAENDMKGGQA